MTTRKPASPARKAAPAARTATSNGNGQSGDGVFDLNAVAVEAAREPFPFRLREDVFTLPHFADLDPRIVARHARTLKKVNDATKGGEEISEADGLELVIFMIEALQAALDERFDAFMAIPMKPAQFRALFTQWQRHSGIQVGESSASSGS